AYQTLKRLLQKRKLSTAVGDEGGFAPRLKSNEEALALLDETLRSSQELRTASRLALDAAASEFYGERRYRVQGRRLSAIELARRYEDWCARYPIVSIEDPFEQDDWAAWKAFTARCGGAIRVVGDDLFVTNVGRLERGIREGAANAILIKLNQIGTVTETVQAVLRAREAGLGSIISHRSGETEDPYIADLAVALNAGAIKTGAPCRSERLAKYNRLLRIEEELGPRAVYARDRAFRLLEGSRS
ncbi:MAG: phosphopyruvate hydratase, partial [Elusimicrobia bacterium]|nr:phosphopyruvate hydratase [Elusimicrobiota bacterium]